MDNTSMPELVMTAVICLIMLGVGTFAFFVTTDEIGFEKQQTETFGVTDPTVANTFTLEWYPESIVLVQQYNGFTWQTVDPSEYSVSGKDFTIQPGGMQG